jgi:hypothetical protein
MSQEKKYDDPYIGYTEEPRFSEDGGLMSWTVKLKEHELEDMLKKYITAKNDKGHGGNAYLTLRMSKAGKAFSTIYDPNSEGAKQKRAAKQNVESSELDF